MPRTIPLFENARSAGVPRLPGERRLQLFNYSFGKRSPADVLRMLRTGGDRFRVVCDSSAFRRERPEFTRDLLALGPVLISAHAVPELEALRNDPSAADLAKLLFRPNGDLVDGVVPTKAEPALASLMRSYAVLLNLRKRISGRSTVEAGATTTPPRDIGRELGPRAAQLAKKFAANPQAGFADEDTVVLAIVTAITERRDVVLIADDLDVHEQFYKFTSLLRDDIASDRLAADVLQNPKRYGEPLPLANYPELAGFVENVDASYLRKRPNDLEYLFPEPRNTRGIYVVRVRDQGEEITWIATDDLHDFLRKKSLTGRNTSHAGTLNVYINLPIARPPALPQATYALFLDDRPLAAKGTENVANVPSVADLARTLADGEHIDAGNSAGKVYEAAVALHKAKKTDLASDWLRELERRVRRAGGAASSIGLVQVQFAKGAIAEDSDPRAGIREYQRAIDAFESATTPALVRRVAMARINKGRALMKIGEPVAASAEWLIVEKQHALSADRELAHYANVAATNRALAARFVDENSAINAHYGALILLGRPPRDTQLYVATVISLGVLLIQEDERRATLRWVDELLDLAGRDLPTRDRITYLSTAAALASAARNAKSVPLHNTIVSKIVSCISRSSIPMRELDELARSISDGRTLRTVRQELMTTEDTPIGVRCSCCSPQEWARADLFLAQVWTAGARDGGALWFRRVAKTYKRFADLNAEIARVVEEATRRLGIASNNHGWALRVTTKRTEDFDPLRRLDMTVMQRPGRAGPV